MKLLRPLFFLICLLQSVSALAVERHAFIVGNHSYEGKWALANPANDAVDMAAALKKLGYKIYSGGALLNLDRESFWLIVR